MSTKVEGTQGIQFPDATVQGSAGMPGNGPAWSAYSPSGGTTAPSTPTLVPMTSVEFSIGGAGYDGPNSKVTPSVAGYYQIDCSVSFLAGTGVGTASLFKNGGHYRLGASTMIGGYANTLNFSTLVYMNGTTDYLEITALSESSTNVSGGRLFTWWQGFLARKA